MNLYEKELKRFNQIRVMPNVEVTLRTFDLALANCIEPETVRIENADMFYYQFREQSGFRIDQFAGSKRVSQFYLIDINA